MSKIIGIDLGSHSLGWAIRDTSLEENQIIDSGVLTFNKGVGEEKGIEFPKVKKRTESRGKRRNYQAEKYRKWFLLETLIKEGLCPLEIEELDRWRKYTKGKKREYPQSDKFIQWLRFDFDGDEKPDFHLFKKDSNESYYLFRTLAVSSEPEVLQVFKDNPYILGRVFYHLVQRRGFRGRDEEEARTMLQGSEKTGTAGRNDIEEHISTYKTLGAALYHYQKEKGGRIRQRYNLRKDYEYEVKKICKVHNLDSSLCKKLEKAIIWQRPLRTQKGLIGNCIYEKNKKRAPISHPLYEEYRTWVFINNLKIIPPLGIEKEVYVSEKIYPLFYKSSNDFKLDALIKQLKKDGASIESNFKNRPNTKVISARLLNSFQDILGDDWKEKYQWESVFYQREAQPKKKEETTSITFEDIWHILFTFDSQENLKNFALYKLELSEEKAGKFSKIKLNQGYATLSLSAIKKIIPYLKKGYLYSHAVYLGNLYKVLGSEKVSLELTNYFSEEIDKILKNTENKKQKITITNSLISELLNSEFRYTIENNRELDDTEIKQVKDKIIKIIGEKTWNDFEEDKKDEYVTFISEQYKKVLKQPINSKKNNYLEVPNLHQEIFNFLQETYDISDGQKKYLWHPSEQEAYAIAEEYHEYKLNNKTVYIKESLLPAFASNYTDSDYQGISLNLLGNPEPLSKGFKNPMALNSLYQLKHLFNYLLQTNKIDKNTRIVIEIARELNDANTRKAIERWNVQNEKENEACQEIIRRFNEEHHKSYNENDETLIKKIRLWREQNGICLYTGISIGYDDIFNGNLFDIEHTVPASMSFDNELKNLTLADSRYNRETKKKLLPTQLINYNEDAGGYTAIEPRFQFMKDKVKHLEELYEQQKKKSTYASTKEDKDNCIQRKHLIGFELKYWKEKLSTFTIDEYKQGWRNNQLRDTQIVTKYALPYLKTVFKKVSVEKASVVTKFKEIYNIKPKYEKKDRNIHSHHAIDAATLTLIPHAVVRDQILLKYHQEIDNRSGKTYHQKPIDWDKFTSSQILSISEEILINNVVKNKTTLPAYKKIRKRGKIQYTYDANGNKIPMIAQGDTIRGQLHGESFYGAIKQPVRDSENKIVFDENKKMKLEEDILLVIRKPLLYKKDANSPGFKTLEEIEKVIVDKDLFLMIKQQVEESGLKIALANGVYMLDKQGNKINKIRRIRCKESLKYTSAIQVHEHSFKSKKEYKNSTLAVNGENTLCLFYQKDKQRAMKIISIFEITQNKVLKENEYFNIPYYNQIETGKGKNKEILPLYAVLKSGIKVFFFKDKKEELKDISKFDLSKRLFKIYQFENDGRIKFKHHLAAGINTELKKENKEYSHFDIAESPMFLRLRQGQWNFVIENKDFTIHIDGTIQWLF